MIRQAGVATVVVKDARGRRLVGRSDDARWLSREPRPDIPIERAVDGLYDVEKPVELGGRGQGVVYVGFHMAALEKRLAEIGEEAARRGMMAFLSVTLLAWLIGTWFGLRLERLAPRLEALSKDPEAFRPLKPLPGGGEMARLVAAFNRMGEGLKAETRRRRELEREKLDLSAMLVHDLKTPLTVIRSGIALLREQLADGGADSGRGGSKRTFELLELSTSRLSRMVEDVLQLARMEEVRGLRERAPVDFARMAQDCAKDFSLVAAQRKQKVSAKVPKGGVPPVLGDAVILRRVLDNLVHNAIEHSPTGGVVLIAVVEEPGPRVRVSVSDSGPGIPPEARAQLFKKFFQKDIKRHVGNVGLGLAFCEKAVHRHDGVIGVDDAEPKGACFWFSLPAGQPSLIEPSAATGAPS